MVEDKYEIGGNEYKKEGSEGIADIPRNKTLFAQKLTVDDPVMPELVYGLETVEDVFKHYTPKIDVNFENENGQTITENFAFNGVGDFSVKNMTEVSPYLRELNLEQEIFQSVIKQLKSNKILLKALNSPETKVRVINILKQLHTELGDAINSSKTE